MNKKFILIFALALIAFIALIYGASKFIQPSPKKEITIATGSKAGQYYQNALKYQRLLAAEKVKVNIVNTSGSIENIQLLQDKKVDVAFIQNGTIVQDSTSNFEALAALYHEPLWLFYKKNLKDIAYIPDFKAKKIAIGGRGSGTQDLASEILKVNGIDSLNTNLFNYGSKESAERLRNGELDAIFLVVSPQSKLVRELLQDESIALFSFKRSHAYGKNFVYLESVDLHEGIINLNKNTPDEEKTLLATTATLLAHKDFPDELVRLLLKKIKMVHAPKSLFAVQGTFPNTNHLDITVNEEASRYHQYGDSFLEKIFPFWIASNLDRFKILLIPLLTLLIPLIKGVLPLYKWSIRSKIYKWYKQIQVYDGALNELDATQIKEQIVQLEQLGSEIRAETKVPLSYMGEYYNLIMHLELVLSRARAKA